MAAISVCLSQQVKCLNRGASTKPNAGPVQVVQIVDSDVEKELWLMANVAEFIDKGDVLIFANQKTRVDLVCDKLKAVGYK